MCTLPKHYIAFLWNFKVKLVAIILVDSGTCRPLGRHTKASVEWLLCMENGLKQSTFPDFTWEYLMLAEDIAQRDPDPLMWPRLSLASDQGPDVCCAVNYLLRARTANVDWYPDDSHGVKNDMKATLRESGLWRWSLLMMAAMNAPHSPFWENMRFQQIRESIREVLGTLDMTEDKLFMNLLPAFLRDRKDECGASVDGVESALWVDLKESDVFRNLGRRVSMMRFMDFPMRCAEMDPEWHFRLYGMLTTLLLSGDMDSVSAAQFSLKMQSAMRTHTEDGERKTIKQGDREMQVAKDFTTNQLHLACLMFADSTNQRLCRAVIAATTPALDWWSEASRKCRSTEESLQWLLNQAGGAFWTMLTRIVEALEDEDNLEYIGFSRTLEKDPGAAAVQVDIEDGMAQRFADLCLKWVGCRMKRMMHLTRGYPTRFVLLLGSEQQQQDIVAEFRSDYDRYMKIKAMPKSKCAKIMKARSLFEIAPVQQYSEALRLRDWQVDDRLLEWERSRSLRVIASLAIEDGVHHCKGAADRAASKRVGDLRLYHTLATKKIAEEIHHYENPVEDGWVQPPRCALLDETAFEPPAARSRSSLAKLASDKASVPWYSPSPSDMAVPIMDLMLAEYLEKKDNFDAIVRVDLIVLLRGQSNIIVRDKTGACGGGKWLLPLVLVHTVGALAWPVWVSPQEPGGPLPSMTLRGCGRIDPIFIIDASDWEARSFQWWSPLRCKKEGFKSNADCHLRATLMTEAMPLIEAVGRTAFGTLPRTTLLRLSDLMGWQSDRHSSLLQLVYMMVGQACQLTDEVSIMKILHLRAQPKECADMLQQLLEEEHIVENCDRDERQAMQQEVKSLAMEEKARTTFKAEWAARNQEVQERKRNDSVPKGSRKGAAAKKVAAPKPWRGPKEWKGEDPGLQANAKAFVPPGGSIWRANVHNQWAGHYRPYPRVSASWLMHGPQEALRIVIAKLWEQHLEAEGRPRSDCPIAGLFAEGTNIMQNPGGASSSSSGLR